MDNLLIYFCLILFDAGWRVTYGIETQDALAHFSINPNTGVISLIQTLDHEKQIQVNF